MERLFLRVLNMSVSGSAVILVILLLRFLLRGAPKKWSYLLWSAAGFRLCCPVSVQAAFSVFRPVRRVARSYGAATVMEWIPAVSGSPLTLSVAEDSVAVSGLTPLSVAAAIWLTGMITLLCYGVVSYIRTLRRVDTAIRLRGAVWQSDEIRSPFILGFFRPRIYVPFGLEPKPLEYVLAHERCHIRRRDNLIKLFSFILLSVHWFNPLCWLSFRLMERDMEMSCDENVLNDNANIRKAYSLTLLSFASGRRFPAASPLAFGETGAECRIRNALRWKRPGAWATLAAAFLCAAGVTVCAVNPTVANALWNYEGTLEETLSLLDVDALEIVYADGQRLPARLSVCAESNLKTLREMRWTPIDEAQRARIIQTERAEVRLCADGWTLTGYEDTTLVRISCPEGGDAFFTVPDSRPFYSGPYDVILAWYREAATAAAYRQGGERA